MYANCIQTGWEGNLYNYKKKGFLPFARELPSCAACTLSSVGSLGCCGGWSSARARALGFALGLFAIISPSHLFFTCTKHFSIAFLYFYDHLQGEIRNKITWSFFPKLLIAQSGSIQISKLARKAFNSWKLVCKDLSIFFHCGEDCLVALKAS